MLKRLHIVIASAFLTLALAVAAYAGDAIARMQVGELASRLGDPALLVVDVRRSADWDRSATKIQSAKRLPFNDIESWAQDLDRGTTIVLYCA